MIYIITLLLAIFSNYELQFHIIVSPQQQRITVLTFTAFNKCFFVSILCPIHKILVHSVLRGTTFLQSSAILSDAMMMINCYNIYRLQIWLIILSTGCKFRAFYSSEYTRSNLELHKKHKSCISAYFQDCISTSFNCMKYASLPVIKY